VRQLAGLRSPEGLGNPCRTVTVPRERTSDNSTAIARANGLPDQNNDSTLVSIAVLIQHSYS
jgi:hypothetical protein